VAGVCLGFAEYFDIDVTIVRVVWLITAFMTGVGFIGYVVAWIVMPDEPYLLNAHAPAAQQATNREGPASCWFDHAGFIKAGRDACRPTSITFLMPVIQSDDAAIAYDVAGSGPPIILLHPTPADHEFFLPVSRFLASRYQLIMPDLRGHGK